ncbi:MULTISPECIES: hypothetical protein [unclassified Prevotella]|uniref:hypothetical protein n=1 Tax=unclassified Prevotella TaxID=2638335 RepID=UPI0013039510|nr:MULTISPECIES: hypothetical protein [unclassified Prevotella]
MMSARSQKTEYIRSLVKFHESVDYRLPLSRLGIIQTSLASALAAPSVDYRLPLSRLGIIQTSLASALAAPSVV